MKKSEIRVMIREEILKEAKPNFAKPMSYDDESPETLVYFVGEGIKYFLTAHENGDKKDYKKWVGTFIKTLTKAQSKL